MKVKASSLLLAILGLAAGTADALIKSPGSSGVGANVVQYSWGAAVGVPPSGFFADNGVYVVGQAPSLTATLSLSAATGSVTATFSAATLLGTASDVGRVITVLDTTYKYCTITAQSSTTVATCTISGGNWSGTGPFANNILWLSGSPTTNTTAFSVPLPTVFANVYMFFPANAICTAGNCGAGASQTVGLFYLTCESTTVCTVKNPVGTASGTPALASGRPTIPASTTAYTSTGSGAFTQTFNSSLTLLTLSIPGGAMGAQGSIDWKIGGVRNNNADTVNVQAFYGGSAVSVTSVNAVLWYPQIRTLRNAGLTNSQVVFPTGNGATSDFLSLASAPSYFAIDSTLAQNFLVKANLVTAATDWYFTLGGTITTTFAP